MESKACELPIIISSSIPETKKNEIILIMVVVDLNTHYVQGGTHRRTNGVKWSHWSWKKWLWRFEATPRLVGVRPCGIHHLFDEMPRKPCDTATLHGSRARIQYFFYWTPGQNDVILVQALEIFYFYFLTWLQNDIVLS